jgi:hypothetical protein
MEEQIEKLIGHTDQLLERFLGLRQKYAFLQPMIFDRQAAQRHGGGARAEGFETIRQALFLSCIQDVVSLTCDKDERTPSVTKIMEALSNHQLRTSLRRRFSTWTTPVSGDVSESLAASIRARDIEVQKRRSADFDETYQGVLSKWDNLRKQSWLTGFKTVRDQITAHPEVRKGSDRRYHHVDAAKLGLKWTDLGKSLDLLQPLVLDLNLIIRNASFAMEDFESSLKESAQAFWS